MTTRRSSCTAILVGKKATVDGSTIIARDEDGYDGINPKTFQVYPAKDYTGEKYVSKYSGVEITLEGKGCRFTAMTDGTQKIPGRWDEQGINEYNVAMSSTETETTNRRVLGYDPLVKNGIDEDSMLYLTLPFVKSAREGVQRLGHLIERYGTGETNGIAFSDKDEVWYLETGGGHHWAAQRIPDNAYAIAPNITCIQEIDFSDKDNFMAADGIRDFVDQHHLNPDPGTFNYRNIFGTHDEADQYYNTPRSWYGQKMFTPSVKQDPTSTDIPFIQRADRQISVDDVQDFLSSHYQNTPYDPFGSYASGDEKDQKRFRSIAMDRNQESSVLQIRNDVPAKYAAIQWINMGFYSYSPYVPFFTNINDTPANYKFATSDAFDGSAYWMYKRLETLVEPHYHDFIYQINAYRDDAYSYGLSQIEKADAAADKLDGDELTDYLTKVNVETAKEVTERTHQLMNKFVHWALLHSKYQFERGDNL